MEQTVQEILAIYDDKAALSDAYTIPAPWYFDERIAELERRRVFSKTWQGIARTDQLAKPGQYVTAQIAGEPSWSSAAMTIFSAPSSMFAAITPPRS